MIIKFLPYILGGLFIISLIGYFYYSQNKIETLNEKIGSLEIQLSVTNETLKNQTEKINQITEIQKTLNEQLNKRRVSAQTTKNNLVNLDVNKNLIEQSKQATNELNQLFEGSK